MNTKLQKELEKELIESFKVFYSSVNQHLKVEDMKQGRERYIEDIKDLMSLTDDADLKVKFVCDLPNGETKHSVYQPIQLFVKNGVTLPEDVETFKCVVRAEFRKNETVFQSTDEHPFFKSETFVVKENAKSVIAKLSKDSAERKEGKVVMVSSQYLADQTGNRIRIGETLNQEL